MVFSSAVFLFYFLPGFLLLYYLLPWKNTVLLAGSLLFYAWGEPRFVPLLLLSAFLNYSVGYLIARAGPRRKALLVTGVVLNLAMLGYYKYLGFFAGILNGLGLREGALPAIVLPLGISFFVFQGISYLVDVYRRDITAQSSFLRFAMYKAMFPQLIAGPIVRYSQIAAEVDHRSLTNARIWMGFRLFVLGLAQKVLIANNVALAADRIFAVDPSQLDAASAWMGVACYSIQILFDFAGYSTMAIGIGHMLGFTYPPNFNRPYSATSITDFWRRWHISLSSWFRDYLYIPLGGNRASPVRTYFNLALVFFLCGLWHGAASTFVIWGLWHGALLVLERLGGARLLARLPASLAQAWTLLCVMIGWVFFRAENVPYALKYLGSMAGIHGESALLHTWRLDMQGTSLTALVVGIVLACWRLRAPAQPAATRMPAVLVHGGHLVWTAALSLLCIASLAAGTYNPFIYFRF
ncbi:membrane-bound O-acyltransferase family protein [Massilia violaceinigra]|uniref:Probable alginate O-acetylase AlgI n=1 Tax=Massilia violaceinigra TaxID=2045208 RepID=A0A2D2DK56_9BURK|nr:MBOAT family protein [Massilia violaceinigra]ATQ75366.1 membrane-bound O-acyltransferase family protein [Massilia violaceinigra]